MRAKMKISSLVKNIFTIIVLTTSLNFGQSLKPGDAIKLSFFNIEDSIKGNYYVEESGRIQFPYIGRVQIVDRDFAEVRSEIIEKYSKLYRNPEINVQSLIRISILGEVGNPGVYYLTGYETISDLLALAGGESSDSKIENTFILRNNTQMKVDLESFLMGENNIQDIGLESGDKVYVPRTWWVGARDASIVVSGVAVLVTIASLFTK